MIDKFEGEYFFLSNFYESPVMYDGLVYNNNEAAFQAQKNKSRSKEFCNLTASEAKRLGRRVNLRTDWETIKIDIMRDIVRCKFYQNPQLKTLLLATDDHILVEGNWWNDTFWGVCKGEGQNHLGKILMQIRKEAQ